MKRVMAHSNKYKNPLNKIKETESTRQNVTGEKSGRESTSDKNTSETEIKDAHASGIGSLARSENQIEDWDNSELEKDGGVY